MKIFISYARADKALVDHVVERLRQIDHEPWVDRRLTGGQTWWTEILRVIRESDVFIIILSPASLASQACQLERRYAQQLGKTQLPIKVAPISLAALPAELSTLQHVDFTAEDRNDEAAALVRALNRNPGPRPLPNPLPVPPPAPLSYLSHLHERIRMPQLSYNDQLAIVNQLEGALRSDDADEKHGGVTLLKKLGQRPDLFAAPARQIERLAAMQPAMPPMPAGNADPPRWQPPANWPNGHQIPQHPGVPGGPHIGAPPAKRTSNAVKVLAWIGAVFVVLVLLSALASG